MARFSARRAITADRAGAGCSRSPIAVNSQRQRRTRTLSSRYIAVGVRGSFSRARSPLKPVLLVVAIGVGACLIPDMAIGAEPTLELETPDDPPAKTPAR